jgi:tRNA(fMet)-specific endonuclease VapC
VSFLLDTDICSAYLKGNGPVTNRFIQYGGRLNISTVTLGELFVWALRAKASPGRLQQVDGLLKGESVRPVDETIARKFGEVRAWQLDRGLATPDLDLLKEKAAGFRLL